MLVKFPNTPRQNWWGIAVAWERKKKKTSRFLLPCQCVQTFCPLASKAESVDKSRAMRRDRSPFDTLEQGGMNGVVEGADRGGVLGLSQDKMALVREKKEEIEKVQWTLLRPYFMQKLFPGPTDKKKVLSCEFSISCLFFVRRHTDRTAKHSRQWWRCLSGTENIHRKLMSDTKEKKNKFITCSMFPMIHSI